MLTLTDSCFSQFAIRNFAIRYYRKSAISEKWPAGGPAEGTPCLYYKKSVFSEKWPAGGPAEGTPYLYYKKKCEYNLHYSAYNSAKLFAIRYFLTNFWEGARYRYQVSLFPSAGTVWIWASCHAHCTICHDGSENPEKEREICWSK